MSDDPERPAALEHPSIRLGLVSTLRRKLIAHLADYPDQEHTVESLAAELGPDGDAELRSAFEIQLHHVHLPVLDDAELIIYDDDAKHATVTNQEGLSDVAEYLRANAE